MPLNPFLRAYFNDTLQRKKDLIETYKTAADMTMKQSELSLRAAGQDLNKSKFEHELRAYDDQKTRLDRLTNLDDDNRKKEAEYIPIAAEAYSRAAAESGIPEAMTLAETLKHAPNIDVVNRFEGTFSRLHATQSREVIKNNELATRVSLAEMRAAETGARLNASLEREQLRTLTRTAEKEAERAEENLVAQKAMPLAVEFARTGRVPNLDGPVGGKIVEKAVSIGKKLQAAEQSRQRFDAEMGKDNGKPEVEVERLLRMKSTLTRKRTNIVTGLEEYVLDAATRQSLAPVLDEALAKMQQAMAAKTRIEAVGNLLNKMEKKKPSGKEIKGPGGLSITPRQ